MNRFHLFWFPGQRPHEGAEHETAGGFHVQRVEAAGLRRGFPLAVPVHRLDQAPPPTTPSARGRHNQPFQTPPSSSSQPRSVNQVCLRLQRNQYDSTPIDFYWSNIWFRHTHFHHHLFIFISFFPRERVSR